MRFEEVYIDGFGKFHDYPIRDLAPGLTVFIGPNEAGKSTILSFIKRILFGFPDGRQRQNPYPPLAGGSHGGRLVVTTSDDKRYVIERYLRSSNAVQVTLPDGSTGGMEALSYMLGPINKNIFENVFAFGLSELQDFETLNNDEIKGRLYSAGTGTGSISVAEVVSKLDAEASNLYKPSRSDKPEVNTLFKKINEVNSRLKEIENEMQAFDDFHRDLEGVEREVAVVRQRRHQLGADLNHAKDLITAWPDWRKIHDVKERLQEVPAIESFPENGVVLLERKLEKLDELESASTAKMEKLEKMRIRESLVAVDERLIDAESEICGLQGGQEKYATARDELPGLKGELKAAEEGLKELLREIGPDWDEEKLSSFDVSIPAKEIVRQKSDEIEDIKEKIRSAESDIVNVERNIKALEAEKVSLDKRVEALGYQWIDEGKLDQQRKALQSLRAKCPILREKEIELRNLRERGELFILFRPRQKEAPMKMPLWPAVLFIAIGIVLLIVALPTNSMILGIVGFAGFILSSIVYVVVSRTLLSSKGDGLEGEASEMLGKQSEESEDRKKALEFELQKTRNEILTHAQICGFEDIPDSRQIEDKDSELRAADTSRLQLDELNNQGKELALKFKQHDGELEILDDKLQALKQRNDRAIRAWKDWLIEKGLEPELSPDGVIDIFATVKTCIEKKKAAETLVGRISQVRSYLQEYEAKISTVMESCGRQSTDIDIDVIVELSKLGEDVELNISNNRELEQLASDGKGLALEIKNLDEKIERLRGEISELFAMGFAESELEFRENARHWEEHARLSNEVLSSEQSIRRVGGDGEQYEAFTEELQGASRESLIEKESQLEESFNEADANYAELLKKQGSIAKDIENIERREEGSLLKIDKMVKLRKLDMLADEWSTRILATTIVRKALERYEKEKQPLVIKEAQSFFSHITQGRYSRIYAPLDESKIYVEDSDGRRKDIQELSRGTAEQLYLSLRFGFIREFSKRADGLPVVFDDIFVNFDPDRFIAAFDAVKELTKTNQVFYFTCHSNLSPLLGTIPDARIIDLNEERLTNS